MVSVPLAFDFGDPAETQVTARAINESARALLDEHGDRFGVHAALPLPDVAASIAELSHALDTLGFDGGVMLNTHYNGVYIGDPAFEGLYRELDRRGCVAWVHPVFPPVFPPPFPGQGGAILEFPFDTTRVAANLIYHDVLTRYPNIRWQLSHLGGALPFVLYRLALMHTIPQSTLPTSGTAGQVGPFGLARRFYYDTAGTGAPEQLAATARAVDASRIVFGTDRPFTGAIFAANADEHWPWLAPLLPRAGDPQPALRRSFSLRERSAIERSTALDLYPRVAGRL